MNKMKIYLFLSLVLLANSSNASESTHSMERFNKTVSIVKPTHIKIVNHFGDIRIRKADDDVFIYHGVAQFSQGQEMTLDYQYEGNQITAIVKLSDREKATNLERFDLALVVPELVTLDIEIEGGKLTSKGLKNAVKVRSNQSDIQLKTSKAVDLFTKSGSIDLSIKSSDNKIQNEVKTYSGSVMVSYYGGTPHFKAIAGNFITSNSAPMLQSLKKQGRAVFYGDQEDNRHISVKTDTGLISMIDLAQ